MAGFPLTAWALRHPWGDDAEAVLDGLRTSSSSASPPVVGARAIADALLDELDAPCRQACARWGSSRVAVVLGCPTPASADALAHLSDLLGTTRQRAEIAGPVYYVAATEAAGAKAIASADRLLRASLADAVLLGGFDDAEGVLLLVERHGDAFVALQGSAEIAGDSDADRLDVDAATRALRAAWSDRPALGYVQLQTPQTDPRAQAERRAVAEACGDVPTCVVALPAPAPDAVAGAREVVLAAASLRRGYTPEVTPRELEHDRVLVHAFSRGGHHVALRLEACR